MPLRMTNFVREVLKKDWKDIKILVDEKHAKGEEAENVRKVAKIIWKATDITKKQLQKEYTQEELRELCLRTKCRVQMTSMNIVHDAKRRLKRAGRLQNLSGDMINKFLTKAVNRKMVLPYIEKDVEEIIHFNRCQLKSDNLFRLKRWRKERLKNQPEAIAECVSQPPVKPQPEEGSAEWIQKSLDRIRKYLYSQYPAEAKKASMSAMTSFQELELTEFIDDISRAQFYPGINLEPTNHSSSDLVVCESPAKAKSISAAEKMSPQELAEYNNGISWPEYDAVINLDLERTNQSSDDSGVFESSGYRQFCKQMPPTTCTRLQSQFDQDFM